MNFTPRPFAAMFLFAPLAILGCPKSEDPPMTPVATATAPPAPRLGATVEDLRFSWSDTKGVRVADISAKSGAGTVADADDVLGELRDARATLYQKGNPVAVLFADVITGDRKTRIMTATGNARVEMLKPTDGIPSDVKADRIVWEYDKNRITGTGNVLYTKENVFRFPASMITGDTRLEQFKATNDTGKPATGNF